MTGMTAERDLYDQAMQAAREIADEMIAAARISGDDPIAWVTGNAFMPPLRSFSAAEAIWQAGFAGMVGTMDAWESLSDELERILGEEKVYLACPDYDNALYVVDMARFEYAESDDGENLQDEWKQVQA